MLTLFMAITNGVTWDDAIRPLRDVSFVAVALVIMYVTFAVFAILNAAWLHLAWSILSRNPHDGCIARTCRSAGRG